MLVALAVCSTQRYEPWCCNKWALAYVTHAASEQTTSTSWVSKDNLGICPLPEKHHDWLCSQHVATLHGDLALQARSASDSSDQLCTPAAPLIYASLDCSRSAEMSPSNWSLLGFS